jgi:hypothetical protein
LPLYFLAFNSESWHGNSLILQKLAVCHFLCPSGMWDSSCSRQNVRPILQCWKVSFQVYE